MSKKYSLNRKTTLGFIWSFMDLIGNQGIQFTIQIILARILLPSAFGLIGMILVFISISKSVIDSGFTQALIRKQDADQDDYSTIFYFNLFVGILIYVILFISAGSISEFFNEPKLVLILRILSLSLIIESFAIIQRVFLIRAVDFKTQTRINVIAGIVSGAIAIFFAMRGYGVWSLVIKTLSMNFVQVLLLWFSNRWAPSLKFNLESFRGLFGFGSKLLVSGLINTIFKNIYIIVIGRFFSTTDLGYYTNAVKLRDVAVQSLTTSVRRVTYPVLSNIRHDETRLKNGFKRVIITSSYIIFPFMVGIAAVSHSLINLLLGDKWLPLVIYLQLLSFAGMLYPLHSVNLNILEVKGRSDLFLILEVVKKAVTSILIIIALWFKLGILGLVSTAVLTSYIALLINTYFSAKEINYSVKDQLKDLMPIFIISLVMGLVVYLIGMSLPFNALQKLVLQVCIGILLYLGMSKLVGIKEFGTISRMVLTIFKRNKN